jgi:serine/threonine-protein kinase
MSMNVGLDGYTVLRELDYRLVGQTVLARQDATGDEVVIRFVDTGETARLLSTVESPYLVRVREVAGDAVVLDPPRGVPLRMVLAEQGVVTVEAALYLLRGSLCGLAAAHAAGVVHGGYRPEVAVIGADGQVRLMDIGVARHRRGATATGDVQAAVAAFVEFLTADATFTAPADLIAATPVTLRELVQVGLSVPVDAVALLAMLDDVAVARYGADWAERGRLWLAVRATELRVEELRAEEPLDDEIAPAEVLLAEESRLRALRAQEREARAARAEEFRAAGLHLEAAHVTEGAAVVLPAAPPRPRPTNRPAAAGAPARAAEIAGAGSVAAHPVAVRRRRRSGRWLVLGGVVALLLGVLFAFWLGTAQRRASAGDSQPAVPAAATSFPASPAGRPSPAVLASPSPAWSPAPPFSPVPDQGRG